MRRVAITGIGIVSSIGVNADEVTASLRGARPGVEFAPEYAEVGGLRRAFLTAAVVTGTAEAEPAVVRASDSHLEWRLAARDHRVGEGSTS